jgi:hypothetical protein
MRTCFESGIGVGIETGMTISKYSRFSCDARKILIASTREL